MNNPKNFMTVGKIGTSHGIFGWLFLYSYTENMTDIFNYSPWYITTQKGHQLISVEDHKVHGKKLLVKFSGITTPEQARLLTNQLIVIDKSQLPSLAKNEYYWSDLIGLTVLDTEDKVLGTINDMMETGSNDVMIIKGIGQKDFAVPYNLESVVMEIDLAKKTIKINWQRP